MLELCLLYDFTMSKGCWPDAQPFSGLGLCVSVEFSKPYLLKTFGMLGKWKGRESPLGQQDANLQLADATVLMQEPRIAVPIVLRRPAQGVLVLAAQCHQACLQPLAACGRRRIHGGRTVSPTLTMAHSLHIAGGLLILALRHALRVGFSGRRASWCSAR